MFAQLFSQLAGVGMIITAVVTVLVILFVVSRFVRLYRRVPPNQVMVIFGRGKTERDESGATTKRGFRLVTGGGSFILPVFEEFALLDLTVMTIETKQDRVYTVDGVPIFLDWVVQVQVGADESSLTTASRAFLGKDSHEIRNIVAQTLSANFRAIVGQMTVEDVHRDRDAFVGKVEHLASDDMTAMGVRVISMGIQEITDQQGYFEAMAKPVVAAIKRDAEIAEAEANREARVKSAKARKEAEQAELNAQQEIVEQKEALELREVEKTKAVGLAQARSDEEVQQRRAAAVKQQQEAEVLTPARAEAEAIEIQANAGRQKVTIDADAAAVALQTSAKAEADARVKLGHADADATKAKSLAEAEGDKAKRLAEAEGEKAKFTAIADGTEAQLMAEAKGKRKLAEAVAARDEINLRLEVAKLILDSRVNMAREFAVAMANLGSNTRIVQFGGMPGAGSSGNALVDLMVQSPEMASQLVAKIEALTGSDINSLLGKVGDFVTGIKDAKDSGGKERK